MTVVLKRVQTGNKTYVTVMLKGIIQGRNLDTTAVLKRVQTGNKHTCDFNVKGGNTK